MHSPDGGTGHCCNTDGHLEAARVRIVTPAITAAVE